MVEFSFASQYPLLFFVSPLFIVTSYYVIFIQVLDVFFRKSFNNKKNTLPIFERVLLFIQDFDLFFLTQGKHMKVRQQWWRMR